MSAIFEKAEVCQKLCEKKEPTFYILNEKRLSLITTRNLVYSLPNMLLVLAYYSLQASPISK